MSSNKYANKYLNLHPEKFKNSLVRKMYKQMVIPFKKYEPFQDFCCFQTKLNICNTINHFLNIKEK